MRKKYGGLHSIGLIFNRTSRGVTFVEVLIAIAILGMAILPSVNVFTSFKKYTIHTEDVQIGLRLAQEKIEEYRAVTYSELKALILSGQKNPEPNTLVSAQQNAAGFIYNDHGYKKFKRKITLSFLNNDENTVLITVYVWWYEGNFSAGDQRFVVQKSLVCREMVI
jgi:prepilin-type N-terminal cleavage/methylation domain-containing protein